MNVAPRGTDIFERDVAGGLIFFGRFIGLDLRALTDCAAFLVGFRFGGFLGASIALHASVMSETVLR